MLTPLRVEELKAHTKQLVPWTTGGRYDITSLVFGC